MIKVLLFLLVASNACASVIDRAVLISTPTQYVNPQNPADDTTVLIAKASPRKQLPPIVSKPVEEDGEITITSKMCYSDDEECNR